MAVRAALEDMAHGDDRAAQVAEHDHAVALVGPTDRVADAAVIGTELAGRRPARCLDPDLGAGHLAGQLRQSAREVRAVRYDYDPDQGSSNWWAWRGSLHYRSGFDNVEHPEGARWPAGNHPVGRPGGADSQGARGRPAASRRERARRPPGHDPADGPRPAP